MNTEPVTKAIPESTLRSWMEHLERGVNPVIPFNHDNVKMLELAYKERGDMLQYVSNQIRGYLP